MPREKCRGMGADSFGRYLAAQLRDLQENLEAEHIREVDRLRSHLVASQVTAATAALTPVASLPVLAIDTSDNGSESSSSSSSSATCETTPTSGKVDSPSCLAHLLQKEANDALNVEDVLDDEAVPQGDATDSIVSAFNLVPAVRQLRKPKRCDTAPATVLQVVPPPASASSTKLLIPRSATSGSNELPGATDDKDICQSRRSSRRPSICSIVSFNNNYNNRGSVASNSSAESTEVAFQVLPVWASSWRRSRRMVRPNTVDSSTGEYPTLLGAHSNSRSKSGSGLFEGEDSTLDISPHESISSLERPKFNWLRKFMIQPGSKKHLAWEITGLLLILHDVFMIPLAFFGLPDSTVLECLSWVIRFFWILDMARSFLTASLDSQGRMEVCPVKVAKRYVRTWFSLDLFCLIIDWTTVSFNRTTGNTDSVRVLQLVRALKLLRLGKVFALNETIAEYIRSEQFILIAEIVKNIAMMLAVAHVIACIWYGIGENAGSPMCGGPGWVFQHRLENADLHVRYAWAFHWSLALFSGENMFEPENTCERWFAIAASFFFFIISCFFVARITTSLTRLHLIASQQSSQLSTLLRYLSAHNISISLAMRVTRNAQHALIEQRRRAGEDSVELLEIVSEPLRVELHFEVHGPVLMMHPFFDVYHTVNATGVQKICHTCVSELSFHNGDVVFSDMETPAVPRMFFIKRGRFSYTRHTEVGEPPTVISLGAAGLSLGGYPIGQWFSEASLWTKWIHRGALKASSECTLLAVDAEKFQRIVSPFPTHHAHLYASAFVEHLNGLDSSALSDLRIPNQQDLVEIAFPEKFEDDEDSTGIAAFRGSLGMSKRLSDRFGRQRTKTKVWQ